MIAPRSDSGVMISPSSAPRRSTWSSVTLLGSAWSSRQSVKRTRVSRALPKSGERSRPPSNTTSVSSASRKFTESSLLPRNVTRRSCAPNASEPAIWTPARVASSQLVSASPVATNWLSCTHTSLSRARRRLPPRIVTPVNAHSMNRALAPFGSSRVSLAKCSPSYSPCPRSAPRNGDSDFAHGSPASSLAPVASMGSACPTAPSVPAEGFLEPPGAAVAGHLGVDDQRGGTRPGQPVPDRGQVVRAAHGQGVAAEAAADRGDVGGREPDRAERVPVRAEVVHLGAVGLVVVDHDDHAQAEPDRGLQLADAHQRAAVAQRGHGQPVRPGDRG